jgi:hypothetical protein
MHKLVFNKNTSCNLNNKAHLINLNEVISINYQCWIDVHVYIVQGWKHIHIFQMLEQVLMNGGIVDNFKKIIMVVSVIWFWGFF